MSLLSVSDRLKELRASVDKLQTTHHLFAKLKELFVTLRLTVVLAVFDFG
jgi:hypothetical protein